MDEARIRSISMRLMIGLLTTSAFVAPSVSAFVASGKNGYFPTPTARFTLPTRRASKESIAEPASWSPQDLTKDVPGFPRIPDDDYIKMYQENPELWPVEFFLIAYRRSKSKDKEETQVLVRRSANGTSKYGVGTGVPATRWLLSSAQLPRGYEWSNPIITFDARNFPEFDKQTNSWIYKKIDICENAFRDHPNDDNISCAEGFQDPELEKYARTIRDHLRSELSAMLQTEEKTSSWKATRAAVVERILGQPNSVAAIQGTLRMSGLFQKRHKGSEGDDDRYLDLSGPNGPNPENLAKSFQIHTMFPQMPDPMPQPSTSPEDLRKEITSRYSRMRKAGKDLHNDKYGRTYTHISTSNVSNTIHGVYLSLDLTGHLPETKPEVDENVPPALDLFGTKTIQREWKSLQELKVLSEEGSIATDDPKPTFISGFIVRELVKDGVISIHADKSDE